MASAQRKLSAAAGSHGIDAGQHGPGRTPSRRVALLGIVLVSLNLRAAATSVPPILDRIGQSFPVGTTAQSLLGTLPLLCFAAFGILTPGINRHLGLERSLILAMVLVTLGELARAGMSQSVDVFILWSVLCLAGMGMANVLVPPAVTHYFPDRVGLVSAIFQTLIVVSASVPSLVAVPATDSFGWRAFIGSWGVLGFAAALPWLLLPKTSGRSGAGGGLAASQLAREPVAWAVMIVFAGGPLVLYSLIAWLPKIVVETRGVSASTAAIMLSAFNAIGLIHSFVVPNILARMRAPYLVVVFAVACMVIGPLGLAFMPGSAWPWILISGFAAMLLNVGLTLVTMRCRTEAAVTSLSSFVQSGGYLLSVIGPLAMGALHSATGGWGAACGFLAVLGLVVLVAGVKATRPVFLDDAAAEVSTTPPTGSP